MTLRCATFRTYIHVWSFSVLRKERILVKLGVGLISEHIARESFVLLFSGSEYMDGRNYAFDKFTVYVREMFPIVVICVGFYFKRKCGSTGDCTNVKSDKRFWGSISLSIIFIISEGWLECF